MNIDDILAPAVEFSSHGIGAVLLSIADFLYSVLYPSNAEAATVQ